MAKRRRKLHRVLEGLGSGLMDAGGMMLRQKLMQDQNAMIADRQEDAAERNQMFEIVKMLADPAKNLDPEVARQFLPDSVDPSKFMPSPDRRAATISDEIQKMGLADVHSAEPRVRRRMKALNLPEQDPTLQPEGQGTGPGGFPLVTGVKDNPILTSLLGEAKAREEGLQREVPYQAVSGNDPETQVNTTRYVQSNKMGDVGPLAQERTTEAEGARQGGIKAETERISRPETVETKFQETMAGLRPEVTTAKAAQEAAVESAKEEARLNTYFQPKFVTARTNEALQKAMADLRVRGMQDQQDWLISSGRAAAQLAPVLQRMAALTKALNTQEGPMARAQGTMQWAEGKAGLNTLVTELDSLVQANLRPLAVLLGVREANVSDRETLQTLKGMGIGVFSTRSERATALRNMRDLITVGPVVAERFIAEPDTPLATRMEYAKQLVATRRQAEQEAIAQGATHFLDPVTNAISEAYK